MKTSTFTVEAVDLGQINEVVISHDGKGYGKFISLHITLVSLGGKQTPSFELWIQYQSILFLGKN